MIRVPGTENGERGTGNGDERLPDDSRQIRDSITSAEVKTFSHFKYF